MIEDHFGEGLHKPLDERILHVLDKRSYEIFKHLFPNLTNLQLEVLLKEYGHMRSYNPFAIPLSYTEYENRDQIIVAYNFSTGKIELIEFKFIRPDNDIFIGTYSAPNIVELEDVMEAAYAIKVIQFLVLLEKYENLDRPLETFQLEV